MADTALKRRLATGCVPAGTARAIEFEPYGYPAELSAYRSDPTEPVDRWYQAFNSSNVRTTLAIVNDRCQRKPSLLVDPFAGAGSAAVVARHLDVPFFGIESDPVLTCVTIAKARATPEHVDRLTPQGQARPDERDVVVRCLELLLGVRAAARSPLNLVDLRNDLAGVKAAHPLSRVVWGDATTSRSWSRTGVKSETGRPVIYCSPPFGVSSPRPVVPRMLVRKAEDILTMAGLSRITKAPRVFKSYADLATGMLKRAAMSLGSATAIMEHEPSDDRQDERRMIMTRLGRETSFSITEALETRPFSSRGVLTLFVGELSPG